MSACPDLPVTATIRPALRRLPVPKSEPPYDDELPRAAERVHVARRGATPAVQGTLALSFTLPGGLPAQPAAPRELRLVPPLPVPAIEADLDFGPQPTSRQDLPDPRTWAPRLVQAVIEVLAGDRPLGQLVRWANTEVYDEIGALVTGAALRGRRCTRSVVRSIHVSEPADGVAEVAAAVRGGTRTTALALRLEGLDGRWQCTVLELG